MPDTYMVAHAEGYSAFDKGVELAENPYNMLEELDKWDGWNDGWYDAEIEHEEDNDEDLIEED